MMRMMSWLGGVGLGIGLMYLLDPDRGPKRREFIRDQAGRSARDLGRLIGKTERAIEDWTRGALTHGRDGISGQRLAAGVVGMTAAAYATRALVARNRRSSQPSADGTPYPERSSYVH